MKQVQRGRLIRIISDFLNYSDSFLSLKLGYPRMTIKQIRYGVSHSNLEFVEKFCELANLNEVIFYQLEQLAYDNGYSYQELIKLVLDKYENIEIKLEAETYISKCLSAVRRISGLDMNTLDRKYAISRNTLIKAESNLSKYPLKTISIYARIIGLNYFDLYNFIEETKNKNFSDKEILTNLNDVVLAKQKFRNF